MRKKRRQRSFEKADMSMEDSMETHEEDDRETPLEIPVPRSVDENPISEEPTRPTKHDPPNGKSNVIPIDGPQITIERFVSGLGPLGEAFRVTEHLENRRTRKFTKSEWQARFDGWLARAR